LETGNAEGNPPVKDGDVVFVPLKPRSVLRQLAVSVVGAVPHPGRFDVAPGTTAYDAITMAGGPATDADLKNIYIEPVGEGQHTLIDWNLVSVSPGSPDVNPVLSDGDKIVVPEQTIASTFSIMGAVRNPNIYPLRGNVSLLDALAMAGGYDTSAVPKDTKVVRNTPNGAQTIDVNADDPVKAADFKVQPNDHIIIGQSKPKSGGLHLDPVAVAALVLTAIAVFK
jgi:protein involved in polysaccharide export with SLBB domain